MTTPTQLNLPQRPRIAGASFDLNRPVARNPARGGFHQDVEMGVSLWVCELKTTELEKAMAGQYKWLKALADDSDQTVYIYDAARPWPLRYPGGSGWGNPTVTSVSAANGTITLG